MDQQDQPQGEKNMNKKSMFYVVSDVFQDAASSELSSTARSIVLESADYRFYTFIKKFFINLQTITTEKLSFILIFRW